MGVSKKMIAMNFVRNFQCRLYVFVIAHIFKSET